VANAVVRGVLSSAKQITSARNTRYIRMELAGRRSEHEDERNISFNVFDSATLVQGFLLKKMGSSTEYDRRFASGPPCVVQLRGLSITPNVTYPYNVLATAEVEEADADAEEIKLCAAMSLWRARARRSSAKAPGRVPPTNSTRCG
jgi:hypothetical protein